MAALKFSLLLLVLKEFMHLAVVRVEYFRGEKGLGLFLGGFLIFFLLALGLDQGPWANAFGLLAALHLFAVFDYYRQVKRVYRGEFPMNPQREEELKQIEDSLEE